MKYSKEYAHMLALALVLFVVLDRSYMAFWAHKYNPSRWRKIVLILATIAALWFLFRRDAWLPFLGESVLPPSTLLVSSPTFADSALVVKAPAGATRVVYWAASNKTGTVAEGPEIAYGKFENAGTAMVVDGVASLKYRKPGSYKLRGGVKGPHVHYKFVDESGMSGPVKTTEVTA
jgi:hypothetical protein